MKGSSRGKREAATGFYGYQWGSALHALQGLSLNRPQQDLRPMATQLLEQHDLASNRLDDLLNTAQAVVNSDIWQRTQSYLRSFSEPVRRVFPMDQQAYRNHSLRERYVQAKQHSENHLEVRNARG